MPTYDRITQLEIQKLMFHWVAVGLEEDPGNRKSVASEFMFYSLHIPALS